MNRFTHSDTLLGTVTTVKPQSRQCDLSLRTGDTISITFGTETSFGVISNLDGVDRDRVATPASASDGDGLAGRVAKYIRPGDRIFVSGIHQEHQGQARFDARRVTLLHSAPRRFLFEDTHWWLAQITSLANEWLDDLFGDSRNYREDDFSRLYRTNLNIYGGKTDDSVQCMATLSRFIYGVSSAYLLTGDERYRAAASAGVNFQRMSFRTLSHDGQYCFWAYGRRKLFNGTVTLIASENSDDLGAIALYEQIYALAGLSQFYRISGCPEALEDIRRTIGAFNAFFLDSTAVNQAFPGLDGYFSHIDPGSMRPDDPALGPRQSRKNWNSIGDHLPAYLINLILALEPLPHGADAETQALLATCKQMLDRCTRLILDKFPDPESPYVNERFFADWKPDHSWGWQQNRAVVGHNLKIAWNLTRIAQYYQSQGRDADAARPMALAERLGIAMRDAGLDLVRGGCFDTVERRPAPGQPIDFVWGNTKDFWQQEQGILAYLILYGQTGKPEYLELARDMNAFWNMFFLDRDNRGVFFRVSDTGQPVIEGSYGDKAGYAIAGYHSFELNYLAHIYMRSYVAGVADTDGDFCLHFRPDPDSGLRSFNVQPDFLRPGSVQIESIRIDGRLRDDFDPNKFQISLSPEELGRRILVRFRSTGKRTTPTAKMP